MKILAKTKDSDIATVYIGESSTGHPVEFVESVQPPLPREEKWVLIISTLYGCPVGCKFCDAGNYYKGRISAQDMLAQIETMTARRYPDRLIPIPKFKIQFARMGDPALNPAVIEVLRQLPEIYQSPGLLPTISTIAPQGSDRFFADLLAVKQELYPTNFQMQFSIHTTDEEKRRWMIPVKTWSMQQIAEYGKAFHEIGGRKTTLNFALSDDSLLDPDVLLRDFSPQNFLIKITPINPTAVARENGLASHIKNANVEYEVVDRLREAGYEVILSIGEKEENQIGSNCGQYITNYLKGENKIEDGYTYSLTPVEEKVAI